MITPGLAIERPGEAGYFVDLNPPTKREDGASSAAGTVSSTSSTRLAANGKRGSTPRRSPAPTTENLS